MPTSKTFQNGYKSTGGKKSVVVKDPNYCPRTGSGKCSTSKPQTGAPSTSKVKGK